jgi:uncharacterized protein YcbK (DUF882 family)
MCGVNKVLYQIYVKINVGGVSHYDTSPHIHMSTNNTHDLALIL